jgi:hypothetical protein
MTLPKMELTSLSHSAVADLVAASREGAGGAGGDGPVFIEAGCIPTVGGNLARVNGAGSGRRSDGV